MIVVDTNIIAYLYLTTTYTSLAEKTLQVDSKWVAPVLWRSEFRNVLALYVRKKALALNQALAIQQEAEDLFANHEYEVPSMTVLSLAAKSNCSAYDCEYVTIAQHLRTTLVTEDKGILKNFPETAMSMKAFVSQT
ncbi:MAG: type II toxin-antitoxin system VapC family toxin [Nitrospinae bacterium]|nr:type II toxin-antitoxin system VapC family toxin [Nitrospinota bacterium]